MARGNFLIKMKALLIKEKNRALLDSNCQPFLLQYFTVDFHFGK